MPRYSVDIAFDCSCYGTWGVEADNPEQLLEKIKAMFNNDVPLQAEPMPSTGTSNWRIVAGYDEDAGKCVLTNIELDSLQDTEVNDTN